MFAYLLERSRQPALSFFEVDDIPDCVQILREKSISLGGQSVDIYWTCIRLDVLVLKVEGLRNNKAISK